MKSDRPLLGSILLLAVGLGLIFGYCSGTSSFSAAYPFSGSTLHIDVMTNGPGAVGGVVLTAFGLVLLLWAVLVAIVSQIGQLVGNNRAPESLLD